MVVQHGGKTSVEGVFAAGDLHDVEWRQVGSGDVHGCARLVVCKLCLM